MLLRTLLNHYTPLSGKYAYSSSFGDKEAQKLNIISVPSIFYGSSIRKGSVKLKYYVTGNLHAEAFDKNKNGEADTNHWFDYWSMCWAYSI